MAEVPLSEETKRRVEVLFDCEDVAFATELLTGECGSNLPFLEDYGPLELERFRFAALKLSEGSLDKLRGAVRLAKQDWRDLLVAAGFADDVQAHTRWLPRKPNRPRPVALDPAWLTWQGGTIRKLAQAISEEGAFDRLPVLADAGCAEAELLGHLRGPGPHARGCWAVDLLVGKE